MWLSSESKVSSFGNPVYTIEDSDFRSLRELMTPNKDQRFTRRHTEPLWEGFIGMFDGPQVVPVTDKTMTFYTLDNSVTAYRYRSSRWWGMSGRTSSNTVEVRGGSAQSTATLAYIAKAAMQHGITASAPSVSFLYSGKIGFESDLDAITSDAKGGLVIQDPFDVAGVQLAFRREGATATNVPLFVDSARARVGSPLVPLHALSSIVPKQVEVIERAGITDAEAQVAALYGVHSVELLQDVWLAAMNEDKPQAAAGAVLSLLRG